MRRFLAAFVALLFLIPQMGAAQPMFGMRYGLFIPASTASVGPTFDTSLGALLIGDGYYGTQSDITGQGTNTKEVTLIANVYCDYSFVNTGSAQHCTNSLLVSSWEAGPTNVGADCEGQTGGGGSPLSSGMCVGMDTSMQFNFNGPLGNNATGSSPWAGDANDIQGTIGNNGMDALKSHQVVITISTDSTKTCNASHAANCFDVLIDGVSVKSLYHPRYFAEDGTIALYNSHGINVWNNFGSGSGSAWLKSLYLSNRAILNYSTGLIDSSVISTKLFASGKPISYGTGCTNVDGQAPLIGLVGDGPGMFTTNCGSLTGLSYQARASSYTGATRNPFSPMRAVPYPTTMPGAATPTGPYMKWPMQALPFSANRTSDTTGFQTGEGPGPGGFPVAVGDAIGYGVIWTENTLTTHTPACSASEDGVAWTANIVTDTGPGGFAFAQTVLLCTRTATTSDLSDATHHPIYAPSWTNAAGRSLGWFMFDYTNSSGGFGNIVTGATYTNGTLTVPAITTSAGSTLLDLSFFGAGNATPTAPTTDVYRYMSYTGTQGIVLASDIYGVSSGSQAARTTTVTQSAANGVAIAVEIKP